MLYGTPYSESYDKSTNFYIKSNVMAVVYKFHPYHVHVRQPTSAWQRDAVYAIRWLVLTFLISHKARLNALIG